MTYGAVFLAGFVCGSIATIIVLALCRARGEKPRTSQRVGAQDESETVSAAGRSHRGELVDPEPVRCGMSITGPWMIYIVPNRCTDPECWCHETGETGERNE